MSFQARCRLATAVAAGCVLLGACGASAKGTAVATTVPVPAGPTKRVEEGPSGIPPWKPAARTDDNGGISVAWSQEAEELRVRARQDANAGLVFLGDSITQGWLTVGHATWARYYAPRHALNLGLGGDTTQNLLWRLSKGALTGLHPRVVVLLIGTNDFHHGWSPSSTAQGVGAAVGAVRAALPRSAVVLLGLLPRQRPGSVEHNDVVATNRILAATRFPANVEYRDLGGLFVGPGDQLREALYEADGLHPSSMGYKVLAAALGHDSVLARARLARSA